MSEKWELEEKEKLAAVAKAQEGFSEHLPEWAIRDAVAHAASLKAREETLKEVGEWLEKTIPPLGPLHDSFANDIAALKAGRKP